MESAREKSIRHGHPSTLHLWWARRPLAACRAVLWSSLVDDPSSWPERFPTEEDQTRERQRLFDILGRITIETDRRGRQKQVVRGLVSWDDIKDPAVIDEGQQEIARSLAWGRGEEPPTKPDAVREYIAQHAPPVYDPFAGGGLIPLEAQRLGLEAHASDLNPVAVLINKALIEIPPKFKDMPPVNPEDRQRAKLESWKGAQGLAADVRYYGKWMRDEAFKRIGHLYPLVQVVRQEDGTYRHATEAELAEPKKSKVEELTVIAWIWARTVKCPNPACGCEMPLVKSFELCTKKGKEATVIPTVNRQGTIPEIEYSVSHLKNHGLEGTVNRKGATCIACETPVPLEYVRAEGNSGRINSHLMGIVIDSPLGRSYISPTDFHQDIAVKVHPKWRPITELIQNSRHITPYVYGMVTHADLFTSRQLTALSTLGELIAESSSEVENDLKAIDNSFDAKEYSKAIKTYLAFGIDKMLDTNTTLCTWQKEPPRLRATFGRQALPMTWDYAEANIFGDAAGDYQRCIGSLAEVLDQLNFSIEGNVSQIDAAGPAENPKVFLVSTDPPYYDNVPYADLADFFYVWQRTNLKDIYPELFDTLLTPKQQELV